MGYKYDEFEILDHAVDEVLEHGLRQLTFGRLAKRIGINDRSIVDYFPTKDALLLRVLEAIGVKLQPVLVEAFGSEDRLSEAELLHRAWPVMASADNDPIFDLFFELVGLAAASIDPFPAVAAGLMDNWLTWLTPRVHAAEADQRATALAVMAQLDGLLILRKTLGPEAADSAARHIGIDG